MPLTFRSVSTVASSSSGNLTMNAPAGGAQGDLYIADISYRSNAAFTPNTVGDPQAGEWEEVATANSGNTTANSTGSIGSGGMWWCIRGSSEPDLVFNRTSGDIALGRITAYTPGSGETVSLDASSVNTLGSASTTVTTGTITTTGVVALVHLAECLARSTTASRARATDPDEFIWRERADSATTTGADCGLAISDATKFDVGATGTLTYTAGSSARHVAIAAAFKVSPAPAIVQTRLAQAWSTGATGSVTTGSFTPTADTLMIVTAATDGSSAIAAPTISDSDGTITWTEIFSLFDGFDTGAAAGGRYRVWWGVAPASPSSMTVTIPPGAGSFGVDDVAVVEYAGADTASPIGATASDTHITDTTALTLSGAPAADSVVVHYLFQLDVSAPGKHALGSNECLEFADRLSASGVAFCIAKQARWGSTSTSIAWGDAMEGATVGTTDLTISAAFEIKAAAGGAQNYDVDLNAASFGFTANNLVPKTARSATLSPLAAYDVTLADLTAAYGRAPVLSPASFALTLADLALQAAYRVQLSAGTFAFTAADITAGRGLTLGATSFATTLADLSTQTGRNVTLSPASFAYAPGDLTVEYTAAPTAYEVELSPASFAFAAANLSAVTGRKATLSAATFAYTPSTLGVLTARKVTLSGATFALSAADLAASAGRTVALSPLSLAFALVDLEVIVAAGPVAYEVELSPATFAFDGQPLVPSHGRHVALSAGSFGLTLNALDAALSRNVTLTAASFAFDGAALIPGAGRKITLAATAYDFTARDLSALLARIVTLSPATFAFEGLDLVATYVSGGLTYQIALGPVSFAFEPGSLFEFIKRGSALDPSERIYVAAGHERTFVAPARLRTFVSEGRTPIVAPPRTRTIVSDGSEPL